MSDTENTVEPLQCGYLLEQEKYPDCRGVHVQRNGLYAPHVKSIMLGMCEQYHKQMYS